MQNVLLQPIEVGGRPLKPRSVPPADHRLREKQHEDQ